MTDDVKSCFYPARDGLRLHYRDFRPRTDTGRIPAICLAGLSRSARDFEPLCQALSKASSTPRRVLAFDYRGRGLSAHDPDWRRYTLETERGDFLVALARLGIDRAHFIGTSRGGLHILGLAATHRNLIKSAVLNDIGPVLEPAGLRRIKGYIGNTSMPRNFGEAIALLKQGSGLHFTGLTPAEWRFFAETTFGPDPSELATDYDPNLAKILDAFDLEKPLPESWPLFDKLAGTPVLTIRGANSDLLSEATLIAMGSRWGESETHVVPGQGHAPLLADQPTLSRIDRFLAAADGQPGLNAPEDARPRMPRAI